MGSEFDHIFSFLWGDRSALEECLKVHPMFLSIAEPYLYADILICGLQNGALRTL
jgi:hypothetical protein